VRRAVRLRDGVTELAVFGREHRLSCAGGPLDRRDRMRGSDEVPRVVLDLDAAEPFAGRGREEIRHVEGSLGDRRLTKRLLYR
jgi:hypothetical protein